MLERAPYPRDWSALRPPLRTLPLVGFGPPFRCTTSRSRTVLPARAGMCVLRRPTAADCARATAAMAAAAAAAPAEASAASEGGDATASAAGAGASAAAGHSESDTEDSDSDGGNVFSGASGAAGVPSSVLTRATPMSVAGTFRERTPFIPLRLSFEERKKLRLMESALVCVHGFDQTGCVVRQRDGGLTGRAEVKGSHA